MQYQKNYINCDSGAVINEFTKANQMVRYKSKQ